MKAWQRPCNASREDSEFDEPKTGEAIDEFMDPHEHWTRYMVRLQELVKAKALSPNTLGVARELRDQLLQSQDTYHKMRGAEVERALRSHSWEDVRPSIERS
ncbi:hypothetical protein RRF57_011973 [Xylaria bambusicola]|uniref:Uncharacterized protein n=1 Tax=Xylaria bambusicola TaxID=326684 RepID=A0AAN7ZDE3_9PEZI